MTYLGINEKSVNSYRHFVTMMNDLDYDRVLEVLNAVRGKESRKSEKRRDKRLVGAKYV